MGNKENQGKLQSIIKFFKDWWPTLLGGYLLFGNAFDQYGLLGLVKNGSVGLPSNWQLNLFQLLLGLMLNPKLMLLS